MDLEGGGGGEKDYLQLDVNNTDSASACHSAVQAQSSHAISCYWQRPVFLPAS